VYTILLGVIRGFPLKILFFKRKGNKCIEEKALKRCVFRSHCLLLILLSCIAHFTPLLHLHAGSSLLLIFPP
jgi:hypothetical protein